HEMRDPALEWAELGVGAEVAPRQDGDGVGRRSCSAELGLPLNRFFRRRGQSLARYRGESKLELASLGGGERQLTRPPVLRQRTGGLVAGFVGEAEIGESRKIGLAGERSSENRDRVRGPTRPIICRAQLEQGRMIGRPGGASALEGWQVGWTDRRLPNRG